MNTTLRPIETAPKDGTFVYLYGESGYNGFPFRIKVGRFQSEFRDYWIDAAGDAFEDDGGPPLFWTPIIKMELLAWESAYKSREEERKKQDRLNATRGENQQDEQDWIFTFCQDHRYPNGYVVIHGTFGAARSVMFDRYKDKWGFQYPSKAEAGIEKFNLQEVK